MRTTIIILGGFALLAGCIAVARLIGTNSSDSMDVAVAAAPTALYGAILLMAAIAYWVLQQIIIAAQGPDSVLKSAVGRDLKGKISPLLYVAAIPLAFVSQWIAGGIYVLVALMWLVPDRRIEHALGSQEDHG